VIVWVLIHSVLYLNLILILDILAILHMTFFSVFKYKILKSYVILSASLLLPWQPR